MGKAFPARREALAARRAGDLRRVPREPCRWSRSGAAPWRDLDSRRSGLEASPAESIARANAVPSTLAPERLPDADAWYSQAAVLSSFSGRRRS